MYIKTFWKIVVICTAIFYDITYAQLPIQSSRKANFTVSEGSYMNVDVSPDGKTLVFDLLGNLYTVPAIGGTAKQLTKGLALNLRPVWSPDGKQIAYISDKTGAYRLHIRNVNGSLQRIISKEPLNGFGHNAIWSPNGQYITIDRKKYSIANEQYEQEKYSLIGYNQKGDKCFYDVEGEVVKYTPNTQIADTIFRSSSWGVRRISPDQNWIVSAGFSNAFASMCPTVIIDCVNLITQQKKILVSSMFTNPCYQTGYSPPPNFSLSPDSKYVYLGYQGKIHRISIETGADEVIPFTAKVEEELGQFVDHRFSVSLEAFMIRYVRSANKRPDGKQIVYSAMNRIYVKDLPSGKPRELIRQEMNQYQPVYSPDGKWVVYVGWSDKEGGSVWCVPTSGGKSEQLNKTPGQYQRPCWSPDGRAVVVVRGENKLGDRDDFGRGQLLHINIGTKAEQILDDKVPLWNQLCFSTNGETLYYEPEQKFQEGLEVLPLIASVNLISREKKILAKGSTKGMIHFFKQRSFSPDGKYAVYTMGEDLYVVPVTVTKDTFLLFNEEQTIKTIRFASGVDPHWEGTGHKLAWNHGSKYYMVNIDKVIAEAAKQKNFNNKTALITVNVTPDEMVELGFKVPTAYGKGTLVLKHPRIITMKGSEIIEDGTIVIKNGRFTAIGSAKTVPIPQNAKVYDLTGKTIMPGMVDLHDHMRLSPDVFPQQSWIYQANLAYGVTTARDPSASYDSFGYAEMLQSGRMIGPRLFSVGRSLNPAFCVRIESFEDAIRIATDRKIMGGTVVKEYTRPNRLQKQWLLQACNQKGLNLINEGGHIPIEQIAMVKDGSSGIEHNPQWGDVYEDVIKLWAASGTVLTPTLQVAYGTREGLAYFQNYYWNNPDTKLQRYWPKERIDELKKGIQDTSGLTSFLIPARINANMHRYGVKIGLGFHGNDPGIGAHNELWALQMGGMKNIEALQAATIVGAEAIGVQKDLGSIEVGKIADLIILNKNPLDDIHNSREISFVMKDGILYDGETLDEIK